MRELDELVCDVLEKCYVTNVRDWTAMKLKIKESVSKFLYSRTHRSPMVLPIIMDV